MGSDIVGWFRSARIRIKSFFGIQPGWYEPADPTPREKCPCCDYGTLPERCNYLLCPICFWEDEGMDQDNPDDVSDPNHGITLRQGRANFREFGVCEKGMLEHVLPEDRCAEYEYRPIGQGTS